MSSPIGAGMNPAFTGMNRYGGMQGFLQGLGNTMQAMQMGNPQQAQGLQQQQQAQPNFNVGPSGQQLMQSFLPGDQMMQPRNDMGLKGAMGFPQRGETVPGTAGSIAPSGAMYAQMANQAGRMMGGPAQRRRNFNGTGISGGGNREIV